jgi:hypothetical protein
MEISPGVGRPPIPREFRDLIRQMSMANPLWGTPRIHGELLMLGIDVAQWTVVNFSGVEVSTATAGRITSSLRQSPNFR